MPDPIIDSNKLSADLAGHSETATLPLIMVWFMAAIMATSSIAFDGMLPAIGIIGNDFGISDPNHAQMIIMATFAGMALGQLFAGPMSDAWGRKSLLLLSLIVYILGTIVCLLAEGYTLFLSGRFIQGIGAAGPFVSVVSIIRDQYKGAAMAKIMSLIMMVFILAPAVAPLIGQGILLIGEWHSIFVFFLIYAAVISLIAYFKLPETLSKDKRLPLSLSQFWLGFNTIINHRPTLLYAFAMGFVFAGFMGYLASTQQLFQGLYGVGELFALYFAAQALFSGVASMINSRIVERFGMSMIVSIVLSVVVGLSALMAVLSFIQAVPFWLFFGYGALTLFCVGMLFGNIDAMAMEEMGHMAGTAAAIIGIISNGIALVIGTLIGQAFNNSVLPISIGLGLTHLFALLCVVLAARSQQASASAQG